MRHEDRPLEMTERVRRIEASRREIAVTVSAIQGGVRDAASWRSWVRRHPLASVAAVALAGFALSSLPRRRRRPLALSNPGPTPAAAGAVAETARRERGVVAALAATAGSALTAALVRRVVPFVVERISETLVGSTLDKRIEQAGMGGAAPLDDDEME